MLTEENLVLTRAEPNGNGGLQFLYRVKNYGIAAVNFPNEDITQLQWTVDVVKFRTPDTLQYDLCHTTDLAQGTLTFRNDKSVNEFLKKAFVYFNELNSLEGMMDQ